MAQPPFMNSTGLITKIFAKIAEAQQPPRFTTDYLSNVLGFGSGSARPIIPLLKRLGFLQADGVPTQLYSRLRNPSERAPAMLEALKTGYAEVYARSEYAHVLPKDKFRDLITQLTGLERDNSVVNGIVGSFFALKTFAGIDENTKTGASLPVVQPPNVDPPPPPPLPQQPFQSAGAQEIGMNLSYTINLNLPASDNPDVFTAIFKALKEHLLSK